MVKGKVKSIKTGFTVNRNKANAIATHIAVP